MPETLFDKIWNQHLVSVLKDGSSLVYIDRVFLHERTGSIALTNLEDNNRSVRNPAQVFCTMDHIIDTFPGRNDSTIMPGGTDFITTTRHASQRAGIKLFDINDADQGISHLISAEQGITLPGLTVVCPDSHTCTLGAMGALAWGIGSSDCEHALATETLRVIKPKQMRVRFTGQPGPGVTAKDIVLYLISQYGSAGAEGMAMEFCGPVIDALSMEARFTLCNMATEFSAFTALIAPDKTTTDYLQGRHYSPSDQTKPDGSLTDWQEALLAWENLKTDADACFDEEIAIDCTDITPMLSWGTSPEQTIKIQSGIPTISSANKEKYSAQIQSLEYMDLQPGQSLIGIDIQGAFIGSCTNGRLSDLQAAAEILKGRKVSPGIKAVCTPGSAKVKKAAEELGLDKIFINAGFEWREPGCSLCFFAGGEGFSDGMRVMSTTNRNFKGRQGRGSRTHISSPSMVAAAAVAGHIVDCRDYLSSSDSLSPSDVMTTASGVTI